MKSSLGELARSAVYTIVSVIALGLLYPALLTLLCGVCFPAQAAGSLLRDANGKVVGTALSGQSFSLAQNFQGRPSAAGKGYDPTASGGTNLGPTSKKLIDSTRDAVKTLIKANPAASGPIPADLVSSSASGLDPDISPEAARYQAPRVAAARGMTLAAVNELITVTTVSPLLGIFGESHVNVLDLNRALDAQGARS